MKFDTSGLDPELMVRHLAAAYGLPLTSPRFLPLGEDQNAFHWLAIRMPFTGSLRQRMAAATS